MPSAVNVLTTCGTNIVFAQILFLKVAFDSKPISGIKKIRVWAVNTLTAKGIYEINNYFGIFAKI